MNDNVITGPWHELPEEMDGLLAESTVNSTIGAMAFPVPDQSALLAVYWKAETGLPIPYHFEDDIRALLAMGANALMFRRAIESAAARSSVSDERRWGYVCDQVRKALDALPSMSEFEKRSYGARPHAQALSLRDHLQEVAPEPAHNRMYYLVRGIARITSLFVIAGGFVVLTSEWRF
jgi:hypothetical protein